MSESGSAPSELRFVSTLTACLIVGGIGAFAVYRYVNLLTTAHAEWTDGALAVVGALALAVALYAAKRALAEPDPTS